MSSFVFVSCWNCFDCKLLDHTILHLDIMLTARNSNPGPTRCTARPLTQTHTHACEAHCWGQFMCPCSVDSLCVPTLCFCVLQSSYSSCVFRCLPCPIVPSLFLPFYLPPPFPVCWKDGTPHALNTLSEDARCKLGGVPHVKEEPVCFFAPAHPVESGFQRLTTARCIDRKPSLCSCWLTSRLRAACLWVRLHGSGAWRLQNKSSFAQRSPPQCRR